MDVSATLAEELRIRAESSFWDEVYAKTEEPLLSFKTSNLFEQEEFFNALIRESRGKRILSVGGGIDSLAVYLAATGAELCSIDVSKIACEKTEQLANRYRPKGTLHILHSSCEHLQFHEDFDLVISRGVLHHINFARGLARIKEALVDGGVLIALEPICLSRILAFFQKKFPFHPQTFLTPDEIKLSFEELTELQNNFSKVDYYYFELFSRPSIAYVLSKLKASVLISRLKRADACLLQRAPFLTKYCQHMIIRAEK